MRMNPVNKSNVLAKLSPQQAQVLHIQAELAGDAFATEGLSYDQIRANYVQERKLWNEGGPEMVKRVDAAVPFQGRTIATRIHYPNHNPKNAALFFIHGGGMVVGSNDTHDRIMRMLAYHADCAVIGIDYSLSPEAQYPVPVHECAAVARYYVEHADAYGLDGQKLAFAGDSGGANLSMGTMMYLRDTGFDTARIKALLLYYGGYALLDSVSMRLYGGAWDGLTEADLAYYGAMYMGSQDPAECIYYNSYACEMTHDMPACFIVSAELDPLRDDSRLLYEVLKEHGVPCTYTEYKGAIHAFLHYGKIMDDANDALIRGGEYFKGL